MTTKTKEEAINAVKELLLGALTAAKSTENGFQYKIWLSRIDKTLKEILGEQDPMLQHFPFEIDYTPTADDDFIGFTGDPDFRAKKFRQGMREKAEALRDILVTIQQCPESQFAVGVDVPQAKPVNAERAEVLERGTNTQEVQMDNRPRKIFLSHKTANKPYVRQFKDMLTTLGFECWMDESDMAAGAKIHREIEEGMENSCAAVFFITHEYIDNRWLGKEIDFAVNLEVERSKDFAIITLVLDPEALVPRPLKHYLYVTPQSQFEALTAVLKALPLKLGEVTFR